MQAGVLHLKPLWIPPLILAPRCHSSAVAQPDRIRCLRSRAEGRLTAVKPRAVVPARARSSGMKQVQRVWIAPVVGEPVRAER